LAGRHGLTGRLMNDWEGLPHPQSKLRVSRQAGPGLPPLSGQSAGGT